MVANRVKGSPPTEVNVGSHTVKNTVKTEMYVGDIAVTHTKLTEIYGISRYDGRCFSCMENPRPERFVVKIEIESNRNQSRTR